MPYQNMAETEFSKGSKFIFAIPNKTINLMAPIHILPAEVNTDIILTLGLSECKIYINKNGNNKQAIQLINKKSTPHTCQVTGAG